MGYHARYLLMMKIFRAFKRILDDLSLTTHGNPRSLRLFAVVGACGMLAFHVLSRLSNPGGYD
ncbi:MAG: hypothetical protein KDD47_25730, partial [Acidobacteria bacterium]|nr:hypothetical protein [Acidobacteriota bacterium]